MFVSAIGTLPAPEEVTAFLDDEDPLKRVKLIDAVLERPEYVDYWALKWGDILRINRATMNEKGMWSMYNWVRGELRANRPIDSMVRELITAQGSTYTSGPTNFFRVAQSPKDLAETTSQVFLGVRLQCAQCHHHPFEKWTQDDYWGLAAYFARLGIKSSSEFGVYGREQVVYVKKSGEVQFPGTGKLIEPKPLGAAPEDDPIDRRRALARWLTSKDNRLFARNLANRFWGYLMGRGIVEPIDDLRVTNPPSNPELLDALADEVVRSGFDQKALIGAILRSRVFQLSSETTPENADDEVFFSHYLVRRLPAEVLHDAICAVTGVPESFSGLPAGSRAIQLPDPQFGSYFLESFGKPQRALACERAEYEVSHFGSHAAAGAQHHGIPAGIAQKTGKLVSAVDRPHHDREVRRRVDREHAIPIVEGESGQGGAVCDAGVVYEDVNWTRRFGEVADAGWVGHIAHDRFAFDRPSYRVDPFFRARRDHDARTLSRQRVRHRRSNPLAATGDDRDRVGEPHRSFPISASTASSRISPSTSIVRRPSSAVAAAGSPK